MSNIITYPALLLATMIFISCQTNSNPSPIGLSEKPDSCTLLKLKFQSEIDSLLEAPVQSGDMSEFTKSGYYKRQHLIDSLRTNIYKLECITTDSYDKLCEKINSKRHYYIDYSLEAGKRHIGCGLPLLDFESSTEWSDDYKTAKDMLTIIVKNNCSKRLSSVIIRIDSENPKISYYTETECRYVKKISVDIGAYGEGKIKLRGNGSCLNFNKPELTLLAYYTSDGKKEMTSSGIMYQWGKETFRKIIE